jgi:predicted DNA-binding protein
MLKVNEIKDLARKQQRVPVPLPDETLKRLDELADQDSRPTANMASVLIQAAIALIDEQGFRLVEGKLRRVSIEEAEEPRSSTHE